MQSPMSKLLFFRRTDFQLVMLLSLGQKTVLSLDLEHRSLSARPHIYVVRLEIFKICVDKKFPSLQIMYWDNKYLVMLEIGDIDSFEGLKMLLS